MKTCMTVLLLLLASSCPYVLSCLSVKVPKFRQLESTASDVLQQGMHKVDEKMKQFVDDGTKLFQTMRTSVSQFLNDISETAETGMANIVKQAEGMRTDLNKHLEIVENEVNNTLRELLLRVDNVGEAINKNVMPALTSILNNANVLFKKTHTLVDIGIVLLLLSGFFVSRHLRLQTGNDFVSCCEYVILSFLELLLLNAVVLVLIITLHKFVEGDDIEQKTEYEMLPQFDVLNKNGMLIWIIVACNVFIIFIFGMLNIVRKSK